MAEQSISLLPLYKGWDVYQGQLIKALEPLTPDQLSLQSAPHLRSVGANAAHIIGARAGWMYYVMKKGDEQMVTLAEYGQRNAPPLPATSLIEGLEATWRVIEDALTHWTTDNLAELVEDTDDNGEVHIMPRQWVIWHLIEHDMHHGGELSFTLGIFGLPGISL